MFQSVSLLLTVVLLSASSMSTEKAALMKALESYTPGDPVGDELLERIDAAALALEKTVAPPDLSADPAAVDGLWVNLFSSQGVVGEIDLSFMTRALPGGGKKGGKARSLAVLQELHPDQRFYRNAMTMTAGEEETPVLYLATADLGISKTASNVLEVQFHTITFAPGRADVSLEALRQALDVSQDAPLTIRLPTNTGRPPSTSTVTYLDEDLRINRGKDYIAILRKVQ